jgi:hypothetical protein
MKGLILQILEAAGSDFFIAGKKKFYFKKFLTFSYMRHIIMDVSLKEIQVMHP